MTTPQEAARDRVLRPPADVVSRRLGDAVVVVHLDTGQMYELNPTAARAWELIGEGLTLAEVEAALLAEFAGDAAAVAAELDRLVADLMSRSLLEKS